MKQLSLQKLIQFVNVISKLVFKCCHYLRCLWCMKLFSVVVDAVIKKYCWCLWCCRYLFVCVVVVVRVFISKLMTLTSYVNMLAFWFCWGISNILQEEALEHSSRPQRSMIIANWEMINFHEEPKCTGNIPQSPTLECHNKAVPC